MSETNKLLIKSANDHDSYFLKIVALKKGFVAIARFQVLISDILLNFGAKPVMKVAC